MKGWLLAGQSHHGHRDPQKHNVSILTLDPRNLQISIFQQPWAYVKTMSDHGGILSHPSSPPPPPIPPIPVYLWLIWEVVETAHHARP